MKKDISKTGMGGGPFGQKEQDKQVYGSGKTWSPGAISGILIGLEHDFLLSWDWTQTREVLECQAEEFGFCILIPLSLYCL